MKIKIIHWHILQRLLLSLLLFSSMFKVECVIFLINENKFHRPSPLHPWTLEWKETKWMSVKNRDRFWTLKPKSNYSQNYTSLNASKRLKFVEWCEMWLAFEWWEKRNTRKTKKDDEDEDGVWWWRWCVAFLSEHKQIISRSN